MKALMSIGVLAMVVIAAACQDPAKGVTQPPRSVTPNAWSDSVLSVDPQDPAALIVIRGATVDGTGAPVAGANIVLDSRMAPADPGYASSMAIRRIGSVTSDASGHFLITSIPRGFYQLGAQLAGAGQSAVRTTVDLRSGSNEVDVTIHLVSAQ